MRTWYNDICVITKMAIISDTNTSTSVKPVTFIIHSCEVFLDGNIEDFGAKG